MKFSIQTNNKALREAGPKFYIMVPINNSKALAMCTNETDPGIVSLNSTNHRTRGCFQEHKGWDVSKRGDAVSDRDSEEWKEGKKNGITFLIPGIDENGNFED
ncbi:hypothetical protein TNCV_2889611 [Trichonephila clavipes]|nr:hypothetical protein TNCV_2889611 [Trichonephila clavipes]